MVKGRRMNKTNKFYFGIPCKHHDDVIATVAIVFVVTVTVDVSYIFFGKFRLSHILFHVSFIQTVLEDYEFVSAFCFFFFLFFACHRSFVYKPLIACEFLFRFALCEVLVDVDVVRANLGRSTN